MALPSGADRTIQRNLARCRPQVVSVAQIKFRKKLLQFILRNLAGSSLEDAEIGQAPTRGQTNRRWVEIHRIGKCWLEDDLAVAVAVAGGSTGSFRHYDGMVVDAGSASLAVVAAAT